MQRHMFKFVASRVGERFSSRLGCFNDRVSDEKFASVSDFTAVLPILILTDCLEYIMLLKHCVAMYS